MSLIETRNKMNKILPLLLVFGLVFFIGCLNDSTPINSNESCSELKIGSGFQYRTVFEAICWDTCESGNMSYNNYNCENDNLVCYCK